TTGHWTRNIAAFSGLVATQQQGSQAVIELSDLQGNVVGTASSSEAAGRPLAMERASTFGEPVSSKPVDKLKWLGTAGVSSELPGGAIAEDGITYVPQLGQALQTTSTTVPSPENTATAYVSSLGPDANALAQAASAQETTIYQEATRKAEEAANPLGAVPDSEGEAAGTALGHAVVSLALMAGAGPIATASSSRRGHTDRCAAKIMIGQEGNKVWTRGWAWCPGYIIPADLAMQVCVGLEDSSGFSSTRVGASCNVGWGSKYPKQIYAHTNDECASGVEYYGFGEVGEPGKTPIRELATKSWSCKGSRLEETANFLWEVFELVSGSPPK
ncbi:MAG: hypothetical protein ACYCUM_03565, partial [Solirubrobacteraceae bacterium]